MASLGRRSWQVVVGVAAIGLWFGAQGLPPAQAAPGAEPAAQADLPALLKRPVDGMFVENLGQWNEEALFRAGANGADVWFARKRVMYSIAEEPAGQSATPGTPPERTLPGRGPLQPPARPPEPRGQAVEVAFVGANDDAAVVKGDQLEPVYNWFVAQKAVTDVHAYKSITYQQLWPGVDAAYYGDIAGGVKSVYTVNPGADPKAIALKYTGADALSLDEKGNLKIETGLGTFTERAPVAFTANGQWVMARYVLDGNTVSFQLGPYDKQQVLYIDPSVL